VIKKILETSMVGKTSNLLCVRNWQSDVVEVKANMEVMSVVCN